MSPIYLLGRRFSKQSEAEDFYKKIIWFSYRNSPGLGPKFNSDTGWGCLIRVGQMVMAAAFKRFFKEEETDLKPYQIDSKIIVCFLENNEGKQEKYSLYKIVKKANSMNSKMDFGSWFTCSQICAVLADLHRKDRMNGT